MKISNYITFSVTTFLLHFIWEKSHISLYTDYEHLSMAQNITFFATLGDVIYSLLVILFIALIKNNPNWLSEIKKIDYLSLVLLGFLLALLIEYKALALSRWAYLPAMPIIPVLQVGLSPILQMAILLPLSVFISSKINKILLVK